MARRKRRNPRRGPRGPRVETVRSRLTLPSMDELFGPIGRPSPYGSAPGGLFDDAGRSAAGRPRAPISARAARLRALRPGRSYSYTDEAGRTVSGGGGVVAGITNAIAQVPVVGQPVADIINTVAGVAGDAVATVTGAPSQGRRGRGRIKFDLIKGRKFGKASKRKLMRLGARNVSRGARGIIKINPVSGGGIAAIVTGALGAGAGYVVATKAVPNLVGRFVPAAAQGLIGAIVGAIGGVAAGRVIGKVTGKSNVGNMIVTGSIVALGVALMSQIVRMLPSSVTAPIGLGGMRDYLQLSGPVPPQLFAGGLNDYVGFVSPAAGQVAEAASEAITEWTPTGSETF